MMDDKPLIYGQVAKIMEEISPIAKGQRNEAQKYQYRGIDDVYNALHPLLARHKVFCVPEIMDRAVEERKSSSGNALFYTRLTAKFTLYAEDGSSLNGSTVGEAMDSGDKSANKAMSAAMKYFFFQVFCIPIAGDNDADATTHEVRSSRGAEQRQVQQPEARTSPKPPDESGNVPITPPCPKCGGSMKDNRLERAKAEEEIKNKTRKRRADGKMVGAPPAFRCENYDCSGSGGHYWTMDEAMAAMQPGEPPDDEEPLPVPDDEEPLPVPDDDIFSPF